MKVLRWLLLLCTSACLAQGSRYDSNVFTSADNVPPGAQSTMFTIPFATVTICGYPNSGEPCTNTVPIFQDQALTVPAANAITADAHGRFGFWITPGTYTYSVVSPSSTYLGTFVISLGAGGGGSACSGTSPQIAYFGLSGNTCQGDPLFKDLGNTLSGGLVYTGNGANFDAEASGSYTFKAIDPSTINGSASASFILNSNGVNSANWSVDAASSGTNSGNISFFTHGAATNGNNIYLTTTTTGPGGSGLITIQAARGLTLKSDTGSTTIIGGALFTAGAVNFNVGSPIAGPATAPSGACSIVGWSFSQDGHATFCNGSIWVVKI